LALIGAGLTRAQIPGITSPRLAWDVTAGIWSFVGSILAIAGTTQLLQSDLERGSAWMLLARPIRPADYLWGRLCGALGLLFLFSVAGSLVLALNLLAVASAGLPHGPDGVGWAALGAHAWLLWMRLAVLAAMVSAAAAGLRSALLTVAAGGAAWAMCELRPLVVEPLSRADFAPLRIGAKIAAGLVPDFACFDLWREAAGNGTLGPRTLATLTLYAVAYVAGYAVLAAWAFRHREL